MKNEIMRVLEIGRLIVYKRKTLEPGINRRYFVTSDHGIPFIHEEFRQRKSAMKWAREHATI